MTMTAGTASRRVSPWLVPLALAAGACWQAPPQQVKRQRVTADNHDDKFPITQGTHAGIDCQTCHGPYETFTHFTCTACHEHGVTLMDPSHGGVAGYAFGPETCLGCHPTGQAVPRAQHSQDSFPVSAGNHRAVPCLDCHTARPPEYTCGDCHAHSCDEMAPLHARKAPDYTCQAPACRSCHADGVVGIDRPSHSQAFFPVYQGNHGATRCSGCHQAEEYAVFNCTDCHAHTCAAVAPFHDANVPGFQCVSASCRDCHPTGEALDRQQHSRRYFPIAQGSHAPAACTDCHGTEFRSFTCTGCHECNATAARHSGNPGFVCTSTQCFACHPDG